MEQETLIYIDDKEKYDASVAANFYKNKGTKNRAYINTLGAELALKYLKSENIDADNLQNMHSIKKILEEFDISDIMLKNIHIDVRVVFDEQAIFIPKSHFEYNLVPDIYVVFQLASDNSYVKFLGFFEPKLINKNNANKDYYFIEKEKLNSPFDLVKYINGFKGDTNSEDSGDLDESIISIIDGDITESDKKHLLQELTKSAELRERFIEYENFEILSSKAMTDISIEKPEVTYDEEPTANAQDDNNFIEDAAIGGLSALGAGTALGTAANAAEGAILGAEAIDAMADFDLPSEISTDMVNARLNGDIDNKSDETLSADTEDVKLDDSDIQAVNLDAIDETALDGNIEDVSVETVDLESIEPIAEDTDIEQFQEETVDLNSIEPIAMDEVSENNIDETVALDSIEELKLDESEDNTVVETVDLNSIEELKADEKEEDIPTETVSLENFDERIDENSEDANEIEDVVDLETFELPQEIEPEIKEEEDTNVLESLENTEDNETEKSATFGNNLLENLAAEDEESVSIEPIEDEPGNSTELFNQLDDVLASSAAAVENLEDIPTIEEASESLLKDTEIPSTEANTDGGSDDKLNVLFNENDPAPAENINELEEIPEQTYAGAALTREKSGNKNFVVTALLCAALLGTAAFVFLKPKNDNTADLDQPLMSSEEITQNRTKQSEVPLETNTPDTTAIPTQQEVKTEIKQPVTELKPNVQPKKRTSESFMSVSRLVWDVPSDLSYSSDIQTYLRAAGKSIKLSLSADLLLATEYAYTNQVKVNLIIAKNGNIESAKIISSSGSSQIDNIVLQSVKDTLNAIKPPSKEINSPSFNLNLIIYF